MNFLEALFVCRNDERRIKRKMWDTAFIKYDAMQGFIMVDGPDLSPVKVYSYYLDNDWEVVQPPVKTYSFWEAWGLMKAGKWMGLQHPRSARLIGYRYDHITQRLDYFTVEKTFGFYHNDSSFFSVDMLEARWIEVEPC